MAVQAQRRTPMLTREQLERYSRQILLEEIGLAGQRRLLESRVLVVGAGGLGSPSALYLAAAGVGTIGIVDGDRVELNNLHRQILHTTAGIGAAKTESARRTIEGLNPDVTVRLFQTTLSSENALEIIGEFDLVVNGSDNFPTRYLVNDACVFLKKPLIDASILKWEGQATTFLPGEGCYRCLFPTPPPPGVVPSCAEGGVLGALAGFMGTLQATEAVKVLLGRGRTLANRLLLYDALENDFRVVRWARNPACPVCGDQPTITELIDYEQFCGLPGRHAAVVEDGAVPEIDPAEAYRLVNEGAQLIDVREPWEWAQARIPGATLIPKGEVPQRLTEIDPNRPVVVHCAVGARSAEVVKLLQRSGYGQAVNVRGGIIEWMNQRLPVETADR
ncbi:MAG TPA: molybdopterin-synthase adenylyltransferase MoeB [bacterium]|jgi:adenylyltransferase/sulfurtransferase|nr:molybdopterin-synthase adenylyltransferase MoeB [bacterium]